MRRLWFVTNVKSGTATREKCDTIEALFQDRGLDLVGRTDFPDTQIPAAEMLQREAVDTLVLFAGDGTINAALCALADWDGNFLILPGGTMNLLAKALHDTLDPHAIIAAAHGERRRVALPYVSVGPHRAYVAMIIGPAASWYKAREAARERRLARMIRAVRSAWNRSFGRGVRLGGTAALQRSHQAVFIQPGTEQLDVAAIDARDWQSLLHLGWSFLTGDWMQAHAVETVQAERLHLVSPRRALALFDGEPVLLEAGCVIERRMTAPRFIATGAAS